MVTRQQDITITKKVIKEKLKEANRLQRLIRKKTILMKFSFNKDAMQEIIFIFESALASLRKNIEYDKMHLIELNEESD